ncbi:MAG: hypothetical protein RIE73_06775 [Coleofasciculus sp. C1-SOL-03]|uniref:hypothetical protein n=1 Tax=Coleofasciculus sp. C1-SOL-03 TaxID=3069522 RepID=UPI0032F7AE70
MSKDFLPDPQETSTPSPNPEREPVQIFSHRFQQWDYQHHPQSVRPPLCPNQ